MDVFISFQNNIMPTLNSFDNFFLGASIIRMINNFLGEETFKAGLINYLNEKKFSNAYHDDLWKALTKQAHKDGVLNENITVKQIMDTWILQSGYPVVNVTRNYDNGTATLNQLRYLLTGKITDKSMWYIPISFTNAKEFNFLNTTPKAWMKNEESIVLGNVANYNEWLYVNVRESGKLKNFTVLIFSVLSFMDCIETNESKNLAISSF